MAVHLAEIARPHLLVHETLAVPVDEQPAMDVVRHGGRRAEHARHVAIRPGLLPCGADPQTHFLALTGVEAAVHLAHVRIRFVLPIADELDRIGAVLLHHFAIGGEIARRQHHGFGADELDVAAVLPLADDGIHAPARAVRLRAANQLLGGDAIENLSAGRLDLLRKRVHDDRLPIGDDRVLLVVPAVRRHGGERRVCLVFIAVALLDRQRRAGVRHRVDQPIHGLFAVVVPFVPFPRVHVEGVVRYLRAQKRVGLHLRQAQLLHLFAEDGRVRSPARDRGLARREDDDLQVSVDARHGRHGPRPDDDHVRLHRLGDVAFGDGIGGDFKRIPCGLFGISTRCNLVGR